MQFSSHEKGSIRWGGTRHKHWVEIAAFTRPMTAHSISHKKCTVYLESGRVCCTHTPITSARVQRTAADLASSPGPSKVSPPSWGQLSSSGSLGQKPLAISPHTPHLVCSKSFSFGFKIHTEFNLRLSPISTATLLILAINRSYPDECRSL